MISIDHLDLDPVGPRLGFLGGGRRRRRTGVLTSVLAAGLPPPPAPAQPGPAISRPATLREPPRLPDAAAAAAAGTGAFPASGSYQIHGPRCLLEAKHDP